MEGSNKNKRMTKAELENLLLENFVSLQKVLTNLSEKFDTLSENITKLLHLFEISAKSFAENQGSDSSGTNNMNQEFLAKLDSLLDQNKTIARGLTLIEGRLRESAKDSNNRPETHRNTRYSGYGSY